MRKSFQYIIGFLIFSGILGSCQKLNQPITTELTPSVYPQDSAQFISTSGPAYVALRGSYASEWLWQQSMSTEESILPARGGNWYNGAEFQQMHYHTWNKDNNILTSNWYYCSAIIGTVNQELAILDAAAPASASKSTNLAELKMVRALAYFMMMDSWGNLPIDTVSGDFTAKANVPRTQVFNFIEADIKSCLPYLNPATGVSTYGRANKYTAYALLAKMYLNAEYYTGTARYDDCIAACDGVINSGKYSVTASSNYLQMFYPTNGPSSPGSQDEFIFAIPYDPSASNNIFPFRSVNISARWDVPRSEVAKFGLPFTPDASRCTLPEFYANFNDPGDVRNGQWLTGLQYMSDGVTPVTVTTTNAGYDYTYSGANPSAPYTYQVNLKPDVVLRLSTSAFDVGNDEIAWNMGYRNIKFYPDAGSSNRNQNNDWPVFRYSDIILMKAEAILRGGTPTLGATALSLVNEVRSNRSSSSAWTSVTLDSVFNERSREFAWEGWHRNDVIRFGKYENQWGFKTDADVNHRIYPIPTVAFQLNPKLTQNPGY